MDELSEWFAGLIHEYVKWARYLYHNGLRRDESIKALKFPYPYRAGQRDLAVAVYRTLERGRRLFVQAPTGIGKTLSTVFPALKAIGEGHGQKLFYLTAKTITRTVAEEALAILRERGLYFRSVTITAKEKLCILEKPVCNPEMCPRAKGHFDRVNDAVYEILHQEFGITRSVIFRVCGKISGLPV
ncbi:MAG: DEAD/DEAH box helicase [Clostridium fessum]